MKADGTSATVILSDGNANIHPSWYSSTQIAFQSFRYGTDSAFIMSVVDLAGMGRQNMGTGEYPRALRP
jgi:hypothetical protein